MTDEELPEDPDGSDSDDAELPPPSTFAGRARRGEGPGAESRSGDPENDEPASEDEPDAADEQEEPPDEFAFEESSEEEEPDAASGSDAAEGDEAAADEVPDPTVAAAKAPEPSTGDEPEAKPQPVSSETVEADTLMLSDAEAAREAAHAGLAKRAESSSFSHEKTTSSHKVERPPAQPAAVAAAAAQPEEEEEEGAGAPPKRRLGWRFMAAAFVIVSSMATATAVSFLLFLSDIAEGLNDPELSAARAQLESVEGGDPQTILILGPDQRASTKGDPGRSDTAMLLRVDPEKKFLSLLSLPRDLYVPIPGHGTDKLNAAYTVGEQANPGGGGTELALRTIKDYLEIPINHVVNVDFHGFMDAVNAIGCVYIDVDRHYFNPTGGVYAEIDVEAGYQRLCGYKALQYVRYRHNDNDLVRGARQQDFIREARQRIPPSELVPVFGRGDELIDIFTENTSSDINDPATIIEMMKSFAAIRNVPVRQVSLGSLSPDGSVQASAAQVDSSVNQFLGTDVSAEPEDEPADPSGGGGDGEGGGDKPDDSKPQAASLVDFAEPAQQMAAQFAQQLKKRKSDLPVYYPTKLVQQANTQIFDESRTALLLGPTGKPEYQMYKFVIPFQEEGSYGAFQSYYGVSGTDWDEPPILKDPNEVRTIDGRDYFLFYEDDRLRLVGWKTSKGSYWVINTLTHALTEEQMLGIATSTRVLGK